MADIIRCKDCKHCEAWRSNPEVIEKYGQIYECSLLVITNPSPDDYCSKAERKETSTMITRIWCPYCHTYWKNISIPKDIWDHGDFICSNCGEYLTRQEEE